MEPKGVNFLAFSESVKNEQGLVEGGGSEKALDCNELWRVESKRL
jgi:hypothetical protein